jgi:hypothetical protein
MVEAEAVGCFIKDTGARKRSVRSDDEAREQL